MNAKRSNINDKADQHGEELATLKGELARKDKIIQVLMDRVELDMNSQGSDYSFFQSTVLLGEQVHERTLKLEETLRHQQQLNAQLLLEQQIADAARARLALAIGSSSDGFALFGRDDRLVLQNQKFAKLWSLGGLNVVLPRNASFEEIIQALHAAGHSPSWTDIWRTVHEDALRGEPGMAELMIGNQIWIRITEQPTAENGIVGTYADISEMRQWENRRHETELSKQTVLLQSTLDHLSQGVALLDQRDRLLVWNARLIEMIDLPLEEVSRDMIEAALFDLGMHASSHDIETIQERSMPDGRLLSIHRSATPDGRQVVTLTDLTERKAAEHEIKQLAFFDPLSGLPNRRLLMDRLKHAVTARTRNGREGALLFIDLDNFKTLNDTLGHDMGDLLLQQVADRLTTCVREGDTVARLGGDEFVVMLEGLSADSMEAAAQTRSIGEKILSTFSRVYLLSGHKQHVTASIGATLFDQNEESIEELLKRADLAMYQAKAAGRNTLRFFDPKMQTIVTARAALEEELRDSLRENRFILFYQGQVNSEGQLTGAEALVRWQHPKRGLMCPAEFIPLAEDTGLILPLGLWVLETACKQLATWANNKKTDHLNLAVNVSARQFRHPDFVDQVLHVLKDTGANPLRLKLELTESLLLDDVEDIIDKMTALKSHGVGFSLDDFGTGYSSLMYLKRLPLDQLKIDQSFVRDVLADTNDAVIAGIIVALARSLGLSVMAEGVESAEQRDILADHGCHDYQGYFFGRPGAVELLHAPNPTLLQ